VTDRIRTDFPRVAREIEHAWIPPSDGTRLAARIWTPKDAAEDPFPRSSSTCPTARTTAPPSGDAKRQPYLAGFGYAAPPGRHARDGRVGRHSRGRVHRAGAGRRARSHRVVGRAALVLRRGRRLGNFLGRVQCAPDRRPSAVSPAYWPWLWPSPEEVTLTLHGGSLSLPVRPPQSDDDALPALGEPEHSAPLATEENDPGPMAHTLRRDLATGLVENVFDWDLGGCSASSTSTSRPPKRAIASTRSSTATPSRRRSRFAPHRAWAEESGACCPR
jgi:hypothetical protein